MRRALHSGVWLVLSCWAAAVAPDATAASLDVSVAASADDAEESASGSVTLNSSDLELVFDKSNQTVGLRFAGVGAPRGASIVTAYVQFEVDEISTAAASLAVQGQAADNPGAFVKSSKNVSSRPRTSAAVPWTPAPWPTVQVAGPDQRTPDLKSIVQEIVNRPGWASGNALVLVVTGTGKRTAEARDGTRAPLLHVEYQVAPPPNQPPSVNAGADQQLVLPVQATLAGAVGDDGLPNPPGVTTHTWSMLSGPGTVSFGDASALSTLASFSAAGAYVLRLAASDSELSAADDLVVTATQPDTTPPTPPTNLTAAAAGARRVDLSWTASSDDVAVASYSVLRDGSSVGTPTGTSFSDTSVSPESTYSYTVTARDAAGNASEPSDPAAVTTPVAASLLFAAAGDHGANPRADASLATLDASGADFYLALGDLDYDETPTDEAWCDYVKARLPTLGPDFPFELVSGNHEQQGGEDGYVLNHAACLPDRLNSTLGVTNQYAAEYYFDYPAAAPLVRVIMIAPDMVIENVTYRYATGDAHYVWLAGAIDAARAAGIPWVVVGMHEVCYTAGVKDCSIHANLQDLLVAKHVDLVLQGHEHNYQRSKQLVLSAACPTLPVGVFDASCVADAGADDAYVKGAGTVFVIGGTFGRSQYAINASDAEFGYFAKTDATTWGLTTYAVSQDRLDARFLASLGAFADAFAIVAPGINTPPVADAGPDQQVTQPNALTLVGNAFDDGLPAPPLLTHLWSQVSGPGTASFADASALTTAVTFSDPGPYLLRLTASDSAFTASDEVTVIALVPDVPYSLDVRVTAGSDDAEEAVSTGAVSRSSSDLELTTDGSVEQIVGMRFAAVSVPRAATIVNAYVQFQVDEVSTGAATLNVQGQAADNPGTFTSATGNVSARPRTSASVAWSPPAWPATQVAGPDQRTPDLSAVVQEIVNRPGWATANALVILVTGAGRRTAEAFDGTAAPILHIEYRVN